MGVGRKECTKLAVKKLLRKNSDEITTGGYKIFFVVRLICHLNCTCTYHDVKIGH